MAQLVKNPPAMQETPVRFLGWEDPLGGGGHGNPLQYSCLENPHGQRSLAGYNPWDCKELDTTEQLSTAYEQGQKSAIKKKLQTWEKEERKEQMLTR